MYKSDKGGGREKKSLGLTVGNVWKCISLCHVILARVVKCGFISWLVSYLWKYLEPIHHPASLSVNTPYLPLARYLSSLLLFVINILYVYILYSNYTFNLLLLPKTAPFESLYSRYFVNDICFIKIINLLS